MPSRTPDPGPLAQLTSQVLESGSTDAQLSLLTRAAVASFDVVDFASITIVRDGEIATLAPTDDVALKLDVIQYELQEGPCYEVATDTSAEESIIATADVARDPRWPRFGPRAAALGIAAHLAHQLHDGGDDRAALNLYSSQAGPIMAESELVDVFASQAALVLGCARRVSDLHDAMESRGVIGEAIGWVMATYQLDSQAAFVYLVRQSQDKNIKLRTLCTDLIADLDTRARSDR